jgi:hypothetical protein
MSIEGTTTGDVKKLLRNLMSKHRKDRAIWNWGRNMAESKSHVWQLHANDVKLIMDRDMKISYCLTQQEILYILKGADDGVQHPELLGFRTLSIVWYSTD